jgi:thymidine kinase
MDTSNLITLLRPTLQGTISVFCGPMCSGKTQELLRNITTMADLGEKVLLVSHSLDTRSKSELVSSHSSQYKGISEKITVVKADLLNSVDVSGFQTIGIDESNFFDDLFVTVKEWLKMGKRIYVSGLDGDYKRNLFGQTYMLLPIADEFVKLRSKCQICCDVGKELGFTIHNDAPFTMKREQGKPDETNSIDVGGLEKYLPVCRFHYSVSL